MERDDSQQEQQSTQQEETSTNQTPLTQPNVTPSTDTEGRVLYMSVLTDKNREIARLSEELESARKSQQNSKPITPEQEQGFFTNPLTSTKELIRQELGEQLAPFRAFIEQNTRISKYDSLKNQVRLGPLGNLLKENEQLVDQLMQGAEPTDATISAAIFQAAGLRASGMLGNQPSNAPQNTPVTNQPPTPNNKPVDMTIPPHLRPSAPSAPRNNNNQPNYPPLTENERTLMRLWGMTEQQYREGQVRNEDNVGALIVEPETTASVNQKSTNKDKANV